MTGCHHCVDNHAPAADRAFRRVVWIALAVNASMFAVEIGAGLIAGSSALLADALDFLSDAASYGITLVVLGLGLAMQAKAALFKAGAMAVLGLYVLGEVVWQLATGAVPEPIIMGPVAILALVANLGVAALLYRHRDGDSNRRSIWLCTRNDAIANLLVLGAAGGVLTTGAGWPDTAVATVIAGLNLLAAWRVAIQARDELATARSTALPVHAAE